MTAQGTTPVVSIVIATYNEAAYLERNVAALRAVLDQTRHAYELVFIDDLSQDGTQEIVHRLASAHPESTRAYFHTQNQGRGATVSEGMRVATGRYVGFLDIDLEVDARYIPAMVLALQQGHEIATAWRVSKLDVRHFHRHALSHGYRHLSRWALGHRLNDTETGFKFFDRERILPILDVVRDTGWFWDTEIMIESHRAGLRITEIPCVFQHRRDAASSVRLTRDVWHYLVQLRRYRHRSRSR